MHALSSVHFLHHVLCLCLLHLNVVLQHSSEILKNRLSWLDDHCGPSPILYLYDTAPLFIYTDQPLRHCIFICSNAHYYGWLAQSNGFSSCFDCNWLKVVIVKKVIVFLTFVGLSISWYTAWYSGTDYVVTFCKGVHNCRVPYKAPRSFHVKSPKKRQFSTLPFQNLMKFGIHVGFGPKSQI